VAHFNLRDPAPGAAAAPVPIMLTELGIDGSVRVRDLWQRSDLAAARDIFAPQVACHGAALFRLSPV
jgi:alpha-galactosidase